MAQIPGDARINQYTATASQTVFIYDFKIYDDDEIKVQSDSDTLTLTTEYTVQDAGESSGGTITLVTGATVGDIITITGNTMIERSTTFTNGGDYSADDINGEYDKIDDILEEVKDTVDGKLGFAAYSSTVSKTLPTPTANKALVWTAAGTALENSTYDPDAQVALAAAEVVLAKAEVTNCQTEVTNCQDEVDLCEAETALCEAETALCEAETALCVAETAKCEDETALSAGYASDSSDSADAAAASAATIAPLAFGSDLIPDTDSIRDLGSTAKRFKDVFGDEGVFTTSLEVAGETVATVNTFAEYRHQTAYNVDGGTAAAATWTKYPLTVEAYDDIGITITSSVLTMPAGTYRVYGTAVGVDTHLIMFRLRQTSGTPADLAKSAGVYSTYGVAIPIMGKFTLAEEATVEMQYYAASGKATVGLGNAHGVEASGTNVYGQIVLEKL